MNKITYYRGVFESKYYYWKMDNYTTEFFYWEAFSKGWIKSTRSLSDVIDLYKAASIKITELPQDTEEVKELRNSEDLVIQVHGKITGEITKGFLL